MFPYSHEVLHPLTFVPNVVFEKAMQLQQPAKVHESTSVDEDISS